MELNPLEMELPLGLSMAMAQRPEALERFAALPEAERRAVVDQARAARSKQDIRACVDGLMK